MSVLIQRSLRNQISVLRIKLISDLTLRSDLLMWISDLLQTDINMILNTNIFFNKLISDLTLTFYLLMLIYDLLHTDINTILNTDTRSNIEISFTHVYI